MDTTINNSLSGLTYADQIVLALKKIGKPATGNEIAVCLATIEPTFLDGNLKKIARFKKNIPSFLANYKESGKVITTEKNIVNPNITYSLAE